LYFAIYWIQLQKEQVQGKPKDNPSQEIS